jgi:hypothetical protein
MQKSSFAEQWTKYRNLIWSKVYSYISDAEKLFSYESILLWGWVPYSEYEKTIFFKKKPIIVNNKELRVYFYMRSIKSEYNQTLYFFFVNTITNKNSILNTQDEILNSDQFLLKRLHENNLSIHGIFNHTYSINCWEALLEDGHTINE